MNGKKAKALRRLVWKGKGNPPGTAVMEEVIAGGFGCPRKECEQLKCWGPREQYLKAKKARKNG